MLLHPLSVLSVFLSAFCVIFNTALPVRTLNNNCQQPTATCTHLRHCQPFMRLIRTLEKPLTSSAVAFLRSQHCGFAAGYPQVCCSPVPLHVLQKKQKSGQPVNNGGGPNRPDSNSNREWPVRLLTVLSVDGRMTSYSNNSKNNAGDDFKSNSGDGDGLDVENKTLVATRIETYDVILADLLNDVWKDMADEDVDQEGADMEFDFFRRRRGTATGPYDLDVEIR